MHSSARPSKKQAQPIIRLVHDEVTYEDKVAVKEEENAKVLQSYVMDDNKPTPPPGVKTVDQVFAEYKDRLAAQEAEIGRQRQHALAVTQPRAVTMAAPKHP